MWLRWQMLLLVTILFACLTRPTVQRLFRHERTVDNALPHGTARKRVGHSPLAAIITLEIDGAALPEYGLVAALTTPFSAAHRPGQPAPLDHDFPLDWPPTAR
jgi:hypothetical protein